MYTSNSGVIPEAITKAFEKSLEVYPCSFKPELRLVEGYYPGTARCNLSLEFKMLWFRTYCTETKKVGAIHVKDTSTREFKLTNGAPMMMVTCHAEVIIDNVVIGSDIASQQCSLDNPQEVDSIYQVASGLAKSRALSNAGFGTISGSDFDVTGAGQATQNPPQMPQSPSTTSTNQAVNNPAGPAPANSRGGNVAPPPAVKNQQGSQVPPMPPQSQPQAPNGSQMIIPGTEPPATEDPLAAAKAYICTLNGPTVRNKPLGHILATEPSTIIRIAKNDRYAGGLQEAATALLPLALKATGQKA